MRIIVTNPLAICPRLRSPERDKETIADQNERENDSEV